MPRKEFIMTTEQLGKQLIEDISKWTPDQKAHLRAIFRKEADLSNLAGRAQHLHGPAYAAVLIKSEEACFREVMEFFEKLKTENVKYIH